MGAEPPATRPRPLTLPIRPFNPYHAQEDSDTLLAPWQPIYESKAAEMLGEL